MHLMYKFNYLIFPFTKQIYKKIKISSHNNGLHFNKYTVELNLQKNNYDIRYRVKENNKNEINKKILLIYKNYLNN